MTQTQHFDDSPADPGGPSDPQAHSVDPQEVSKFAKMAEAWWDPTGDFRPLHRLNPVRVGFIRDQVLEHFERPVTPDCLGGLSVLDIGCGGGLVCEPLRRLGAQVTGIDATHRNISIAQAHAQQSDLDISYRAVTSETLMEEGQRFDVVLALEVIEHVNDPQDFVTHWEKLLNPGGLVIASTINKSLAGFALGVVGAEYVMRWLPVGTHDWRKFVTPTTMQRWLDKAGLRMKTLKGMSYHMLSDTFSISANTSVNYICSATRALEAPPTKPEFEVWPGNSADGFM